jgi:sulfonate transport system substrate-binding protein
MWLAWPHHYKESPAMNLSINRVFSLFAAPALAAVVGWLPPLAQAAAVKEIRIAVPDLSAGTKNSGGGVSDVLRNQQLLEKAFAADGIKIQWNYFKGAGPVINEAFANGQVDFAYLGDLAAIIGKANGVDTRLLAATGRGIKHYLGVVPGSGIKTLQDLKGKRVAIFRGTASQLSFDAALASQGLSEKDFKVINLDFNASIAALAARQIDATWGLSGLNALQARGLADLPLNTRDLGGAGSIQAVLVGSGAFVDAHPELVARLLDAQQQAVQWLSEEGNKEAYIQLVSELASYPPVILQRDLQDEPLQQTFRSSLDQPFLDQLQASVDLAAEQRLIRKPFKVAQWLAPQAIRPAPAPLAADRG